MFAIHTLFELLSNVFVPSQSAIRERHERYLSEAVDMYDLERRMRELDEGRAGPVLGA